MRTYIIYTETKRIEHANSLNISEEYLEVVQLSFQAKDDLGEDNKSSTEKNEMIKRIKDKMNTLFQSATDVETSVKFNDIIILAVAYYNLGLVYVNSKDKYELTTAFMCLKMCLELLEGRELDQKAILTYIGALNEINTVFYKLKKEYIYNSYKFLKLAMEAYVKYTKEDNYSDPVHIARIFDSKEEKESNPRIILEILHFTTIRNIASQYFVQPKDKHEFVMYMHVLLKTHLSEMVSSGMNFREDCLDWALTLFDMSKYFLANDRYVEARNYLVTADYVTYRFSEDTLKALKATKTIENGQNSSEILKVRFLYLSDSYDYVCGVSARSWGNYGVLLLRFWQERFLKNQCEECKINNLVLAIKSDKEQSEDLLIFRDLRNDEVEGTDDQITHTCIMNYADANSVFVKVLKHLQVAKKYFTADTDTETYAKIILEISAAYKYLAGFEHKRDIQLELHKQRVKYLEDTCNKFHEIIDTDTEFRIYKRVWYEIVTSCSTVMDLMLEESYCKNFDEFRSMSKEVDRFAKLILGNINLYLHV